MPCSSGTLDSPNISSLFEIALDVSWDSYRHTFDTSPYTHALVALAPFHILHRPQQWVCVIGLLTVHLYIRIS